MNKDQERLRTNQISTRLLKPTEELRLDTNPYAYLPYEAVLFLALAKNPSAFCDIDTRTEGLLHTCPHE
jgi:hypothetical protein